jgi:hypothetical protein
LPTTPWKMTFSVVRYWMTVSKQLLGGVETVTKGPRQVAEGLMERNIIDGLLHTLVGVMDAAV